MGVFSSKNYIVVIYGGDTGDMSPPLFQKAVLDPPTFYSPNTSSQSPFPTPPPLSSLLSLAMLKYVVSTLY